MRRRVFCLLACLCLMITGMGLLGPAAAAAAPDYVRVTGYDPTVDYSRLIQQALEDGSPFALQMGAIYEQQRNLKIAWQGLPYPKTDYFSRFDSADRILAAMAEDKKPKPSYSQEDLDLLSRIIYAEAGSNWIPDWVQRAVGSVVLNRVKSGRFPNTIHDVIYQRGQYSPTWNGAIHKTPDARTIANARYVLENGSTCPANVVYQSTFRQGSGVWQSYTDPYLGSTEYFCYY